MIGSRTKWNPYKLGRRGVVLAIAAGVVVASSGLVAYTGLEAFNNRTAGGPAPRASLDFELVRIDGSQFSGAELEGRPFMVFFGFTNCPEICPTTLYELSARLGELGSDVDALTALFISVDPERDTQEALQSYMTSFDRRITALRGSREETDKALRAFGAYSRKFQIDDGYTVDHTAVVMLYDRAGVLQGTLDTHESAEVQIKKLRRLVS